MVRIMLRYRFVEAVHFLVDTAASARASCLSRNLISNRTSEDTRNSVEAAWHLKQRVVRFLTLDELSEKDLILNLSFEAYTRLKTLLEAYMRCKSLLLLEARKGAAIMGRRRKKALCEPSCLGNVSENSPRRCVIFTLMTD